VDDLYTLLDRLESDGVVLDLGCGRGSFQYERCRGRIVAIDLSLPVKTSRLTRIAYIEADSGAIPLRDASVDVAVSNHTLEHFPDYKKTLAEIRRVLSPRGWLWIAVPNGYGFDDALYRRLFAGGGHVNRFEYQTLVGEVERLTETRLLQSCDLFSSFIYLKKPAANAPGEDTGYAGFLDEIPAGFLTFSVLALNTITRLIDKTFGTQLSRYGWAFVFARQPMPVDSIPSYFNVCRGCGSGVSSESLKSRSRPIVFGLGVFRCPNCEQRNILVQPPPNFQ
jgi:SAM-dependent methyltransferase